MNSKPTKKILNSSSRLTASLLLNSAERLPRRLFWWVFPPLSSVTLNTPPTRLPLTTNKWHGSKILWKLTPLLMDGRSSSSLMHPLMDLVFVSSKRTTLSTAAAGLTIPTMPNAVNSSNLSVNTVASRAGSLVISILDKITKIPSLSPPSTPRMVPTPTVDPVSLSKPLSCAEEPPVMDVNNHVFSAVTRMDLKSALLTIKRMVPSVSMLPSLTLTATMRLVSMLMKTKPTNMTNTSRSMLLAQVMNFTPRMMASRSTMKLVTSWLDLSTTTLLLGGD
mmetsp:Transcript_9417/g.12239  ORF Transcript_9417/g.12239 Transcript_9417/m.12239 type:complete len:278 (+) Transcript_9417:427-1260(+)